MYDVRKYSIVKTKQYISTINIICKLYIVVNIIFNSTFCTTIALLL